MSASCSNFALGTCYARCNGKLWKSAWSVSKNEEPVRCIAPANGFVPGFRHKYFLKEFKRNWLDWFLPEFRHKYFLKEFKRNWLDWFLKMSARCPNFALGTCYARCNGKLWKSGWALSKNEERVRCIAPAIGFVPEFRHKYFLKELKEIDCADFWKWV